MADYIGKNINMVLLLLIIGIVILLVSITVFFQFGLKSKTSAFELTSENLSTCENKLQVCNEGSSEKEKELASAVQDIGKYDQIYEGKVAELNEIEDELGDTRARVKSLELIKSGLESEKSKLEQEKNVLNQNIYNLNKQIDTLDDDVAYYKNKWDCCRDDPPNCGSC